MFYRYVKELQDDNDFELFEIYQVKKEKIKKDIYYIVNDNLKIEKSVFDNCFNKYSKKNIFTIYKVNMFNNDLEYVVQYDSLEDCKRYFRGNSNVKNYKHHNILYNNNIYKIVKDELGGSEDEEI